MKLTLKLMLVICLFSSIALADEGNMGSGGRTCPTSDPCRVSNQSPETSGEETDSILAFIQKYVFSIFE